MENCDRKKIIQILSKDVFVDKLANPIEALADYLIDNGVTFKTKEIITNYDRIKSMSVEEMASALIAFKDCNCNCPMSKNKKRCYLICDNESAIKKWLEQEVEE